jgi:aerobic-type carbon monoxide dehydrogenase small subunit (CoxS/CutS family)
MTDSIRFRLNGSPVALATEGGRTLLWALRTDLGVTGPKYGCGEGHCGACTVLVDDRAVRACETTLKDVDGSDVITIEGLARNGALHPLQEAFVEHGALQCGFCTPGMVLKAYSLLMETPSPTPLEIIEAMEDNLCRCGAHGRIIRAIETAAQAMKGGVK